MPFEKRIVIISDSCALPREELPYEKTYFYLLKKFLPNYDIINTSTRGNTISNIIRNKDDYYLLYNPDILIVHIGIVDLYPRPYPNNIFTRLLKKLLRIFYIDIDAILKKCKLYYKFK